MNACLLMSVLILAAPADQAKASPLDDLQGEWSVVEATAGGKKLPEKSIKEMGIVVGDDCMQMSFATKKWPKAYHIKINAKASPAQLELDPVGEAVVDVGDESVKPTPAIFECKRDSLRIAYSKSGGERPADFSGDEDGVVSVKLKRTAIPERTSKLEPKLLGTWKPVELTGVKEPKSQEEFDGMRIIIGERTMRTYINGRRTTNVQFLSLDPKSTPKVMELMLVIIPRQAGPRKGIYSLDGDTLTIVGSDRDGGQPKSFDELGEGEVKMVFKRVAEGK